MNASGIGVQLRRARLSRNLSLAEVSRQTKIAARFLELIEESRFDELPGVLFARNFVRQYASAVALDPAPLLAGLPQLDDAVRQLPAPPRHPHQRRGFSGGFSNTRDNSFASSVVFLLLALGAGFAVWARYIHSPWDFGWPRVSAASKPPAAAPVVRNELPKPIAPSAPETSAVPPQSQHPVEVAVTAIEAVWVQLTADGKTAFTGTLQPNETRQVSADEKVKIVAGNAGGLSVSLNGKKLDSLGPPGQVRAITLTAAGPQPSPIFPQPPLPTAPAPDRL
jgi:cytoskeletal protein RodZ